MKEIKISEYARQQIRRLFSQRNTVNTLKKDPELTTLFDNFAFDEALKLTEGPVLEKTRAMCILASTIGCNAMRQFKAYVDVCLNVGIKPREIREVVYQTVPYVGFSKVIDFLLEMNLAFEDNDIKLPLDDQSTTTPRHAFRKDANGLTAFLVLAQPTRWKRRHPRVRSTLWSLWKAIVLAISTRAMVLTCSTASL